MISIVFTPILFIMLKKMLQAFKLRNIIVKRGYFLTDIESDI